MKYAVIIAAALLAGCASTPDDVRQAGTRFELRSQRAPADALGCIARNAERRSGEWAAHVRPGEALGTHELIVRSPAVLFVAEATPAGPGSSILLTVSNTAVIGFHKALADEMMAGC